MTKARPQNWMDEEIAEGQLPDKRLDKRLRQVSTNWAVPWEPDHSRACQDWANIQAAGRFFSNGRVNEQAILKGHFDATRDRVASAEEPILVLQDTTEFTYQREKTEAIGVTKVINSGKDKAGRPRLHTVCGLLMHSSLAVTTQGLPLGLNAVKFWTRDKLKGTAGDHTVAVEIRNKGGRQVPSNSRPALDRKQKRYPPLTLTYIHARERDQPTDRDRVDWRLVTNLPVHSAEQAIEKLSWYALR
ncbi:transposase DNA-binding-containing protein [Mesorhizobium sp.]|uniref:IS4/Tn5 family transposase DNA-binding protein n=1 Tax=Mesorhizobium sp. TaxID=1871066 RepID=UPI0025D0314B|nr:transposase DNA-binding-containing protein [Mesorhizobium sp.]